MPIRFGPSGNSEAFYDEGHKHTYEAMEWIAKKGLSAYEYSFGRGVRIGMSAAEQIREQAAVYDIAVSVHAPYYINLATDDAEKLEKNIAYFTDSQKAALWLGAKRVIFHPGAPAKQERSAAFAHIMRNMGTVLEAVADHPELTYCPETMGKINQLGDLKEIIMLCAKYEQLIPTIDFAHLHARTGGGINSQEDFAAILDELENGIGHERTSKMHVHFSKIEFTAAGGEKQHRTFDEQGYGPFFEHLAPEIIKRGLSPIIICESKGTMAKDAESMLRIYNELSCK